MGLTDRIYRVTGLVRIGIQRALSRATHTARQRVVFSILGVAIAIALLVTVTALGIGLATGTTVYDSDIDYWIVPDSSADRSPLLADSGVQFGDVHATNDRIVAIDGVQASTPVLSQVLSVDTGETTEYVLVVGVSGDTAPGSVAGLNTTGVVASQADQAAVLSEATADLLSADAGDSLTIAGTDGFQVTAVEASSAGPTGELPTVLVQLRDLQQLTGALERDQADQFVVETTDPDVREQLTGLYPESTVQSRGELTLAATLESDLPLALSVSAFLIAVVIGTLFVVTTMSMEVLADQQELATLSAIGLSTQSQLGIIAVQTLTTTGIGGLVGAIGGLGVIQLTNTVATTVTTSQPIATSTVLFIPYGVGAGVLIGLLSLVYVLFLTRRVTGGVPQ